MDKISVKEISAVAEHDGQKAAMMLLANMTIDETNKKSEGRKPETFDAGWQMSLHSGGNNLVGLWSCWLEDRFHLGYPKEHTVDSLIIKQILGVEIAKPVTVVSSVLISENSKNSKEYFLVEDIERNGEKAYLGYAKQPDRQWSEFYGPKVDDGRVWIKHDKFEQNGFHYPYIKEGELLENYYGHNESSNISTYPYSFCNKFALEGPTTDAKYIQPYREKFIKLLIDIAFELDTPPTEFCIKYDNAMVPENLYHEGYKNIKWIKGEFGKRNGYGNDLVFGEKENETIAIKSANGLVPWITYRQINITGKSKEEIYDLMIKSLTF